MHELLAQFGVDWKLLIAQIINFFLLLVILRVFAYGPVMKMLNERRRKIAEGMAASEESKKRLAEAKEDEQKILLKAEADALGVVDAARKDAEIQGKNIVDAAHKKSEQVIALGQKKLEEEKNVLHAEVAHEAQALIAAGLVKVVGKLQPEERDRLLIQEALRELQALPK